MEVIMWCYGLLADLAHTRKLGLISILLIAAIIIFDVMSRLRAPKK